MMSPTPAAVAVAEIAIQLELAELVVAEMEVVGEMNYQPKASTDLAAVVELLAEVSQVVSVSAAALELSSSPM
jgi:hypothetical protein